MDKPFWSHNPNIFLFTKKEKKTKKLKFLSEKKKQKQKKSGGD